MMIEMMVEDIVLKVVEMMVVVYIMTCNYDNNIIMMIEVVVMVQTGYCTNNDSTDWFFSFLFFLKLVKHDCHIYIYIFHSLIIQKIIEIKNAF